MKAAFIAFDECALWQVALLQSVLRRHGWMWRTLTVDGNPVMTDGGIRLLPDAGLESSSPSDFALVVIPGGDVTEELAEDPRLHRFLRQYDGRRGRIAASCASVAIVGAAGLLSGRSFTCLSHTVETQAAYFQHAIYTGHDVCVDENLITSKGHAHVALALEVCQEIGLLAEDPKLENAVRRMSGVLA